MRVRSWEELNPWLDDTWDERMRANEEAMLRDGITREEIDSIMGYVELGSRAPLQGHAGKGATHRQ